MSSFVDAYVKSSEAYENSEDWESIDGGQWCQQRYSCVDSNSSNKNDDHDNSDSSDSSSETTTQTESVNYIMINRVTKKWFGIAIDASLNFIKVAILFAFILVKK